MILCSERGKRRETNVSNYKRFERQSKCKVKGFYDEYI
jgi:hypothetical protein